MKVFISICFIVLFLHIGCKETESNSVLDPFYQNIDPSVTMIAKINSSPYYGKEYIDPSPPTIFTYITAIEATDSLTNDRIVLSKYMISGDEHPFIYYSGLNYSGNPYHLLHSDPYRILLSNLSDTLISGNFYGTFISDQILDTIKINNGIFNIRPDVPDNFFVSCSLKNTYFESQFGKEYFNRIYKKFQTSYDLFDDSTEVIIKFNVGRISDNFVGNYNIWRDCRQVTATIYFSEGYSVQNSLFTAFDGSLQIDEMITIVEPDTSTGNLKEISKISKASFELHAKNDNGDIINITQGEYSYYGFNK